MDYLSRLKLRFYSMIGNYAEVEFAINGHRLTAAQMHAFQRLSGLSTLEPGMYWLNPETGAMGHEGEQAARTNVFRRYIRETVGPGQRQPSAAQRRQPFNAAGLAEIWTRPINHPGSVNLRKRPRTEPGTQVAEHWLTKPPAASGHDRYPKTS